MANMIAAFMFIIFMNSFLDTFGESTKPAFCRETRECFTFQTLCQTKDYDVRSYKASVWAGTEMKGRLAATVTAFWRLFRYIQGKNEGGVKINMTAPVITKVSEDASRQKKSKMYFLLPAAYQDTPPVPTDSDVFIENFPPLTVFVNSFGGWMTSSKEKKQLKALADSLNNDQQKYFASVTYSAGYNSPMELTNRHNEVWYEADGQPKCNGNNRK
ncbi:heme-binding protein 2-like [Protopterus annectens]|uniref:heme-binding protein 2-like n=1 Tax=Protopterus annectens TaxID=7888 RepID=UPI001CFADB94|nr:heme-binding protein 2-like [Protopterus annectens]XP_043939481.1 heme-binding protein 2-like [Protopterus annectens]